MNIATCPKCHKPGVEQRHGRNGAYLANVETYPSGKSYFRTLHTREECTAHKADFEARIQESIDADAREASRIAKGKRGMALTARYKAIFGQDAIAANWDRVNARWLS
jgi:hypothetical protein